MIKFAENIEINDFISTPCPILIYFLWTLEHAWHSCWIVICYMDRKAGRCCYVKTSLSNWSQYVKLYVPHPYICARKGSLSTCRVNSLSQRCSVSRGSHLLAAGMPCGCVNRFNCSLYPVEGANIINLLVTHLQFCRALVYYVRLCLFFSIDGLSILHLMQLQHSKRVFFRNSVKNHAQKSRTVKTFEAC